MKHFTSLTALLPIAFGTMFLLGGCATKPKATNTVASIQKVKKEIQPYVAESGLDNLDGAQVVTGKQFLKEVRRAKKQLFNVQVGQSFTRITQSIEPVYKAEVNGKVPECEFFTITKVSVIETDRQKFTLQEENQRESASDDCKQYDSMPATDKTVHRLQDTYRHLERFSKGRGVVIKKLERGGNTYYIVEYQIDQNSKKPGGMHGKGLMVFDLSTNLASNTVLAEFDGNMDNNPLKTISVVKRAP